MSIELITIFITVAIAHFLALLSPGPDFLLVVKSGVKNEKRTAIGVAIGIATANAIYIALCLIGVGAILASSIVMMTILKIAGGLFLTYLAIMAIKAKRTDYAFLEVKGESESKKEDTNIFKEFLTGLLSGILNPKNPLFYLSLFTLVLNNEVGLWFKIVLGAWMTLVVFAWDAFIIFVLSRKKVRFVFNGVAFYIDKIAGVILGVIGVKILQSAVFDSNNK